MRWHFDFLGSQATNIFYTMIRGREIIRTMWHEQSPVSFMQDL